MDARTRLIGRVVVAAVVAMTLASAAFVTAVLRARGVSPRPVALDGKTPHALRPVRRSLALGGRRVRAARLESGRVAYLLHCVPCHGLAGDGKGPAAHGLEPPPRDLTKGLYKFASVPAGELPVDADFLRTLRNGLHGTGMLAWRDLPDRQLLDIVHYLKTFAPRWRSESPGVPVEPPPDPFGMARRAEAEARGLGVYHGLARCQSCHPAYAGPDAFPALRDDPTRPARKESEYGVSIVPPDFTRDPLRAGDSPADLYRTIAAGIGGTAMPTWQGAIPDDDIWAMAYYVRSLRAKAPAN